MTRPGPRRPGADGAINPARAIAIIVVLVLVGVLVLYESGRGKSTNASTGTGHHPTTTSSTTPPPPASTTTTTVLPAPQVKVQVLNGVLTGTLAGQWSAKLRANPGYITETADNATSKVTSSVIYILTPGYLAEADALARAVGLPASAVNTSLPAPASAPIPSADRQTANLVLVIGNDLAANA